MTNSEQRIEFELALARLDFVEDHSYFSSLWICPIMDLHIVIPDGGKPYVAVEKHEDIRKPGEIHLLMGIAFANVDAMTEFITDQRLRIARRVLNS